MADIRAESRRPRLFGTDGIRGPFGAFPLDEPTVTTLGYELGLLLQESGEVQRAPLVSLGGDTRDSTPTLCAWLVRGLRHAGADCRYLGVVPTPAVAHLAARSNGSIGAAIAVSASHNPHPDNGIKILDGQGFKWPPESEAVLEDHLLGTLQGDSPLDSTASVGLTIDDAAVEVYLAALRSSLGTTRLEGLRVALDCGNGAASAFAEPLFRALGAEVELLHAAPDGRNINLDCGSTQPAEVSRVVTDRGCDLGFAFDGDADRAILIDEQGGVRDGDAMLYLWALELQALGLLDPPAIVATSMSNLGLQRALLDKGIALERCDVGDRQVIDALRRNGLRLGGEQSGHLVDTQLSTTGDGLLTALQLSAIRARSGRPISQDLLGFRRYPQILLNVRVASKPDLSTLPTVQAAAERVQRDLGEDGRLVLRYSGTEPLARIMIEGPDQDRVEQLAQGLATVIEAEIG